MEDKSFWSVFIIVVFLIAILMVKVIGDML